MKTVVLLSALCILGSACATSDTDPDLEAWTREVRVLTPDQVGERPYEELAGLEETEPIRLSGEDVAIDAAQRRLRRRAAKLDADAVVIVFCDRAPVRASDSVVQSEPSILCQGVAIRWTRD